MQGEQTFTGCTTAVFPGIYFWILSVQCYDTDNVILVFGVVVNYSRVDPTNFAGNAGWRRGQGMVLYVEFSRISESCTAWVNEAQAAIAERYCSGP